MAEYKGKLLKGLFTAAKNVLLSDGSTSMQDLYNGKVLATIQNDTYTNQATQIKAVLDTLTNYQKSRVKLIDSANLCFTYVGVNNLYSCYWVGSGNIAMRTFDINNGRFNIMDMATTPSYQQLTNTTSNLIWYVVMT